MNNVEIPIQTTNCLKEKQELQKEYTSNWIWRAVSAVVDSMEEGLSIQRISSRLNVPMKEIVLALEGLEDLGIIERTQRGYKKILRFVYFSDRDLESKNIMMDHSLISSQILTRLAEKAPSLNHFYRTSFLSTTKNEAEDFFHRLEQLMKDFVCRPSTKDSSEVYALTFTGVNLTQSEGVPNEK